MNQNSYCLKHSRTSFITLFATMKPTTIKIKIPFIMNSGFWFGVCFFMWFAVHSQKLLPVNYSTSLASMDILEEPKDLVPPTTKVNLLVDTSLVRGVNMPLYTPALGFIYADVALLEEYDQTYSEELILRNQDRPLGRKILRGAFLIGSVELGGMIILNLMPKEITKWESDYIKSAKKNLARSFTQPPVWDKDEWAINYIGHPYAGSIYYNALRSQGATIFQSFAFSTVESAIWEYVIEGIAEQPSIQDLIITPVLGSVVGELTHIATLRMRRNGFNFLEKAFVIVLNPTYWANNGFD